MFTYEETLARLRGIAAGKGIRYRYVSDPKAIEIAKANDDDIETDIDGTEVATGCYYRYQDGSPGCLVGQLLYDIDPDFVPEETGFRKNLLPPHIQFEDDALELLKLSQLNQDCGETWVNAVEDAEQKLREVHQRTLEQRG